MTRIQHLTLECPASMLPAALLEYKQQGSQVARASLWVYTSYTKKRHCPLSMDCLVPFPPRLSCWTSFWIVCKEKH